MKKIIVIITFLCFNILALQAQTSIGYLDTESILQKMPSYSQAQKQIDNLVAGWKKEIEQKHKEIEEMYKQFQAEKVLLTPNEQQKREDDIVKKEKEVREYKNLKMGADGDLFKKRQELIKPIQDEVYNAVQNVANRKRLDLILDKGAGVSVIYANPKLDISSDVIKELGISNK